MNHRLNARAGVETVFSDLQQAKGAQRLDSVELVRGLAALAVCLFHFTKYLWPDGSAVREAGSYGWAGVESFFVISGFIIPFAMQRSGYRLSNFARFLAKRYVRLAPPYFAAILLSLVLWAVGSFVPGFRGESFRFETGRVRAHVFFLNDLAGLPWLNPVFWTLAIEFQYYIAIGILFPLLFSDSRVWNTAALMLVASAAWLPGTEIAVWKWSLVFLVGIILAQWRLRLLATSAAAMLGCLILILIWLVHGRVILAASLVTVGLLLSTCAVPRWGLRLGQLSYAVYLVHVPIGGRVVNLGNRFVGEEWSRWAVLLVALAVSYTAAQFLFSGVERPALTWSSRIRYSTVSGASSAVTAVAAER